LRIYVRVISEPEFERIEVKSIGQLIHGDFQRIGSGGDARSAHVGRRPEI